MQQLIFIVNGYGVPKDIFQDDNYHFYLHLVFNQVWDSAHNPSRPSPQSLRGGEMRNPPRKGCEGLRGVMSSDVLIILSGGPTDCFPPYKRTEAGEMKKFFTRLMQRDVVRSVTKQWKMVTQARALTTVENLVYAKEVIQQSSKPSRDIHVCYFCEQTRAWRSRQLMKTVFPKNWKPTVIPIDFDVSANRYLSDDFIRRREQKSLMHELWALENKKNLQTWISIYRERIAFLRKAGSAKHAQAVKEWWEQKLASLPVKPK